MENKSRHQLTFNSFFAGIGGFDLAFEQENFLPKFQCEVNSFCKDILNQHWPEVPLHGDITGLQAEDIPEAVVWCGGFPCQDVSVARGAKGRQGLKGKNSGLFYPYINLIEQRKPPVVLIENVTGLLSSHNGQDFRVIIERLAQLGYTVAWRVLNSRYFGAPQSRPRVFICASLNDPYLAIEALFENNAGANPKNKRRCFLDVSECEITGAKVAQISYCLAATSGRHTGTDWSRTYVSYDADVRRMTPQECEGVQGFPVGWTMPSHANNGDDVDTPRYQALGNAVAVPVVRWIAKRLVQGLNRKGVSKSDAVDDIFQTIHSKFGDFDKKKTRRQVLSELHLDTDDKAHTLKWLTGGVAHGDICVDVKAPEAPSNPIGKKLIDVIEKNTVDDRYFLSENAAEGILRRVYSQDRKLFDPMHSALVKMCERRQVA